MPKETGYLKLISELMAEEETILDELIEEEIVPLIKYNKDRENEAFDKAYKEFQEIKET